MNIIFWILVLVALVCVWFCLSSIFRVIGRFFSVIVQDAADALNEREDEK